MYMAVQKEKERATTSSKVIKVNRSRDTRDIKASRVTKDTKVTKEGTLISREVVISRDTRPIDLALTAKARGKVRMVAKAVETCENCCKLDSY